MRAASAAEHDLWFMSPSENGPVLARFRRTLYQMVIVLPEEMLGPALD